MNDQTDVLIVGGGLNGGTLALALSQAGLRVTLADAAPRPPRESAGFDGRSYALAIASTRVLAALGLWAHLRSDAQPILDIKVSDGKRGEAPSPFVLHFDHAEIEEGPMGHMVEDRHLRPVLMSALNESDVDQRFDTRVISQEEVPGGIKATFANGHSLIAKVLIGADGKLSGTAKRAGIKRLSWQYDQTALVAAIRHEKPNNGVAHQLFLPAGPLAILPLKGNRVSIVWSERGEDAKRINALDEDAYLDHLRPLFGDFLGDIQLDGARFSYPLGLTLAHSFIGPRTALLGDAAHAVHPIAGQGLNAGLRDIAALAEVLIEAARRGEDIGNPGVLARYQQWRRFDATSLAVATDAFNRLFSNDNGVLRAVRDLGLGAVNALPGLRRSFMREAAGLTGDLPRLAKGQPL